MACKFEESVLECKPDNSPLVWENISMASTPSNPWNKTKSEAVSVDPSTLSFKDLMSEDLAKTLQQSETETIDFRVESVSPCLSDFEDHAPNTSSDFMLACWLQQSYNEEHDKQIQREEKHYNKNSKLSISFSKYKVCPEYLSYSEEEDEQHLDDENRALDRFEESKRTDPVIPACGYTRHNNQIVTKHDKVLTGRRNAERVMSFPPSFNTGDAGGFDMQISNNVYNKLHRTAKKDEKRKERVQDKVDKATVEKALDPKTRMIIYKLVNSSVLEGVNQIISMGKESVVIHANGGIYEEEELPSECAVKVFKTTLTDFKTREKYIRSDYRFKDRMSKNNNKMTIQLWAEKEFHNLRRLEKAKIPSPKPLFIKKYLLVMSFIGQENIAAPKLKYTHLGLEQWCEAYEQVIDIMTKMFRTCNLIHADLSEYNILWHENKCWVIDLGQAVEPTHPNALKFFYRDCTNIIRFFRSKGLTKIPSPLELFNNISGIGLSGEDDVDCLIEKYERNREMFVEGRKEEGDKFEFLWNEIIATKHLREDVEEVKDENTSDDQDVVFENTNASKNKKKNKRSKKKKSPIITLVEGEDEEPNSNYPSEACANVEGIGTNEVNCFSLTNSDCEKIHSRTFSYDE